MQKFFSTEFCFFKIYETLANFDLRNVGSHNQKETLLHIPIQFLTLEAAQAETINEDFTSLETVLPLPSFGRNLQRLPQQAFWRWSIQNLPCGILSPLMEKVCQITISLF